MSTNSLSAKNIQRKWHLVDASGKVLGRLATDVARILMGKNKANYVPYLDIGDFVVVTNASKVKVTGKKMQNKIYYHHSGYPGGLKAENLDKLLIRRPTFVIEHAVSGMLPKNKLGRQLIKKLKVFAEADHPFKKQVGQEAGNK